MGDWIFWRIVAVMEEICKRRGHKMVPSTISSGGQYCERCWEGNLIDRKRAA